MNTKRTKFCVWLQRKIYPKRKHGLRPVFIRFLWIMLHPIKWIKLKMSKYKYQTVGDARVRDSHYRGEPCKSQ